MTTDTSTHVVTVEESLANYGFGAGVQYLVDTTAQALNFLLPRASVTLANNRAGSVIVDYTPYVPFRLTGNAVSTAVNPGQVASASITIQANRAANATYTFRFPTAYPNGLSYMVMAAPNTGGSGTAFYTCTAKVESSTSCSVWCRKADNTFTDGDFYVYTVP